MSASKEALVAIGNNLLPVGKLRYTKVGARQFSAFNYAEEWLRNPRRFAVDPEGLPLQEGTFNTSGASGVFPGVLQDASPDSWGRGLLKKAYGLSLDEFDFLTLTDDFTRQGALRLVGAEGNVLTENTEARVPRLANIEELIRLAHAYERSRENIGAEIEALVGAAGSLGGARPKANVIDGDTLWIAKFSSVNDHAPVEPAEVGLLNLARDTGLRAAEARLHLANSPYPVALIRRFDRNSAGRVPYISARTALGMQNGDIGCYNQIADFLRLHGKDPVQDIYEIWRRVVFTILVRNTDDHMKNHGFIYAGDGLWRLSPAFDINAQPERHPQLKSGITEIHGVEPKISVALEAAPLFDVEPEQAKAAVKDMAQIIAAQWVVRFREQGLSGGRLNYFRPAFEHEEMEYALSL